MLSDKETELVYLATAAAAAVVYTDKRLIREL